MVFHETLQSLEAFLGNYPILGTVYLGNTVQAYLMALVVFVGLAIVFKVFKFVVIARLKKLFAKTKTQFDDIVIQSIDAVRWPFFLLLSLYISLGFIQVPGIIPQALLFLVLIGGTYYVVKGVQNVVDFGTRTIIEKSQKAGEKLDTSLIDILNKFLRGLIWLFAFFFILASLGINITPMLAGLGIGGIAIAFALQNVLVDVFAAFSLYFDKPFQLGDFIVIGSDMGVVKKIGIKSTRIETLQGQELVMSNKELTEARVHNYKRMARRRIVFAFGVTYETPTEKMRKVPGIIRDIMSKVEQADLDRVHFQKFSDSSLDYEVVYYLRSSDYTVYMDTQQEINLAIKEAFENEGIDMAYPTRTVLIKREG